MIGVDLTLIDELKNRLDSLRPLPAEVVRNLEEVYRVEWTYNSNAIEGNTLTLLETKLVLEQGLTIGGKSFGSILKLLTTLKRLPTFKSSFARIRS